MDWCSAPLSIDLLKCLYQVVSKHRNDPFFVTSQKGQFNQLKYSMSESEYHWPCVGASCSKETSELTIRQLTNYPYLLRDIIQVIEHVKKHSTNNKPARINIKRPDHNIQMRCSDIFVVVVRLLNKRQVVNPLSKNQRASPVPGIALGLHAGLWFRRSWV